MADQRLDLSAHHQASNTAAMAPSTKSGRENASAPETPMAWKLPADVLREIIARSDDHCTLVRCAATCSLLRRDILSRPFDRRVTQAAPRILAAMCHLNIEKPPALLRPTTPAASSFCHDHLSRLLSRKALGTTLVDEYKIVASRRGLVVFRLRKLQDRPWSDDMCVYDPMSGARSFFSSPPGIRSCPNYKYVMLTAADGIDTSSFLVLAYDLDSSNTGVHTVSSCGTWRSVTDGSYHRDRYFPSSSLKRRGDPAILSGGVVHSLTCSGVRQIMSYDLGTGKRGSVELPSTNCKDENQLYLATSSDGKKLKLLAIQGFIMSVWLQVPVAAAEGGSGWSLETVIDMEEELRLIDPNITDGRVEFEGSGNRTGEVVNLAEVYSRGFTYRDFYSNSLIVFDLETKKMHRRKRGLWLLEIDLPSRLQTMKTFS